MKLLEILSKRTTALKVAEVAEMFAVTQQHIYKMAANGQLPSFLVGGAIRFDPDDVSQWLRKKAPHPAAMTRLESKAG